MELSQPDVANISHLKLKDQTFVGISEGMQKLIFGFEEIYEDVKDAIVQQFNEND
jgi:hypothetical protein